MIRFLLSLFNLRFLFKPKVWVNPLLLDPSGLFVQESKLLPLGSEVFDRSGRLCTVVKQGNLGALKRLSCRATRATTIGRAFAKGMSLKFRYMMAKFSFTIWRNRMKRKLRAGKWHFKLHWPMWLCVGFPMALGLLTACVGVL